MVLGDEIGKWGGCLSAVVIATEDEGKTYATASVGLDRCRATAEEWAVLQFTAAPLI